MPMCTSTTKEEHQKRPPSGKYPRTSPSVSNDLKQLIEWADSTDVEVQFQAAWSFADLAITEEVRDRIRSAGGIAPLVRLLSSHRIEIQKCIISAVANLALCEVNQKLLVDEGVLIPLIAIAKTVCTRESDDEETKLNIARALANLAYCNEKIEIETVEQGGLDPLIFLFQHGSEETRLEAVAALANLARNVSNQRKIVEVGALKELVGVIKSTQQDNLLEQASRCLANISLNARNQDDLKESGATLALITMLPKANSDVQRLATMALANMSAYETMQAQVVSEGALTVLFDLIQCGNEDVELQVRPVGALRWCIWKT